LPISRRCLFERADVTSVPRLCPQCPKRPRPIKLQAALARARRWNERDGDTISYGQTEVEAMVNFEMMLGRTLFQLWPDLPRDIQEQIFEALPFEPGEKRSLATLLHDHHPRTAHPPKPTQSA
jgi:hypothetical protein